MLDETDLRILKELEVDSSRTNKQLAEILSVSRTTLSNRIRKLERTGVIKAYKAIVDHKKLGRGVTAIIHIVITSRESADEITDGLKMFPHVEDVYLVLGQYDIIAKVRFRDAEELSEFIYDRRKGLRRLPGIARTETMIVLNAIKEYGI